MTLITQVQRQGGASTTQGQASFAPSWPASTLGTTLVVLVGLALSGAPVVTPPVNWVLISSLNQGPNAFALYAYLLPGSNNPGGITTATWSLTNTNAFAWEMAELSNVANSGVSCYDAANVQGVVGSGTAVALPNPTLRAANAVLEFCCWIGNVTTTSYVFTGGAGNADVGNGWLTLVVNQSSTTGTTNVKISARSLQQGAAPSRTVDVGATLGVAGGWCCLYFSVLSTSSGPFGYGPDGATPNIDQGYAVAGRQ